MIKDLKKFGIYFLFIENLMLRIVSIADFSKKYSGYAIISHQ